MVARVMIDVILNWCFRGYLEKQMNDKQLLIQAYSKYKSLSKSLTNVLSEQDSDFRAFAIPDVTIDEAKKRLKNGDAPNFIKVVTLSNWTDRVRVMNSITRAEVNTGQSTSYVSRTPGIVVVRREHDYVRTLIKELNSTKKEIALIVQRPDPKGKHTRTTEQKHEFIHDAIPGVMTEQLYRCIHVEEKPVSNVWFNWTSRPTPKTIEKENYETFFSLMKENKRGGITKTQEEWNLEVEALYSEALTNGFDKIQVYKTANVLPTQIVKYQEEGAKRKTKTAATPIILMGQENSKLPVFSELGNYVKKPRSADKPMRINSKYKAVLSEELKLVGVYDHG